MDLDECFKKGFIKRTEINRGLIKSLIEMSQVKKIAVKKSKSDKITISAYVSLAYDSLREVLEAVSISRGYKVISHICIGELLRKIFINFEYEEFDRLRWIRNSINYYGKKISFVQGKQIIRKIFKMREEILTEFLASYI